jgi:hypothetical protein
MSSGLIIFSIAIVSTPELFGIIGVLLTAVTAMLGFTRGFFGTQLLLKSDRCEHFLREEAARSAAYAGLATAILSAAMLLFVSQVGLAAIAIAIAAPLVCAQDVLRHFAVAVGRPQVAAVWDGMWCVGTVGLLTAAWLNHRITAAALLFSWAALALIATVGLAAGSRISLSLRGPIAWLRIDGWNRFRYGIDLGLEPFGLLLVLALVSVLLNADAAAAIRGASALLAPVAVIAAAIQSSVISESVRRATHPAAVWRQLVRTVSVVTIVICCGAAVFLMIPPSLGFYILGQSFEQARQVLPATLAEYIAASALFCLTVFLRSFNESAAALTLKLILLLTQTCLVAAMGILVHSAVGAACGLAFANALVAVGGIAVVQPWRHAKKRRNRA